MTSMVHSKVDIVLPLQVQHNYFIFQISLWQQKKKKKKEILTINIGKFFGRFSGLSTS